MFIEGDKVFRTPLEGLVGGFGRPDTLARLEALAGMDNFSLRILTGEIQRGPTGSLDPNQAIGRGRRRFTP